jgi:hypothetical protein
MDGNEPLWLGFFFCLQEVGKGREQDAEAFVKRNELEVVETVFNLLILDIKKKIS